MPQTERVPREVETVPRGTHHSAVDQGFTITQFHNPAEKEAQMRDRLKQSNSDPRSENGEVNQSSRGRRAVYPQGAHEYLDNRNRSGRPNEQQLMRSGSWSQPLGNSWREPTWPERGDYSRDDRTVNSVRNIVEARHFMPDTTASTQRYRQRTGWDNQIQASSERRIAEQSSPY